MKQPDAVNEPLCGNGFWREFLVEVILESKLCIMIDRR